MSKADESSATTPWTPATIPTQSITIEKIAGRYGFIFENIVGTRWIFTAAMLRNALKSAEITAMTRNTGSSWLIMGTIIDRSMEAADEVVVVVVVVAFSSAKATVIEAKADNAESILARIFGNHLTSRPISKRAEEHLQDSDQ